jgi:hypothetical protein
MTIWFVFPVANEDDFRAAYSAKDVRGDDNTDEAEQVGSLVSDEAGTKFFTGSSRITTEDARQLGLAHAPWLAVHETPDFLDAWVFPTPT